MTLHARLTELLEGHVLARVDRHAWWCSCRADCTTVGGSFAGHLASVLLSAVGVAVADRYALAGAIAGGIQSYAAGEGTAYSYHGDGSALEAMHRLDRDASGIAEYIFTSAALGGTNAAEGK